MKILKLRDLSRIERRVTDKLKGRDQARKRKIRRSQKEQTFDMRLEQGR